jgi:competence protein ComEC
MKLFFAVLAFMNWYYIPIESPSAPVEVEGVDVNLKRNELAFTFFSLSDGEAALIQHANGENILVNTGGQETIQELERLLALFHVQTLSTVILTSTDNVQNLKQVIQKYNVQQLVTGESAKQKLAGVILTNNMEWVVWKQGEIHHLMPGLSAEVVHDGMEKNEATDISFQFFHHQIFYVSSSSHSSEQTFLDKHLKNVNIVKLPSYAAKGSFSDLLIEHLDPQLAVIFKSKSVKPDPDLLEMLHEAWIDVYFTKQHGTVTIKLTDSNYDVITILSKD